MSGNNERTDGELVAELRNGNADAFGLLYSRYYDVALQTATHLMGNAHEAEDVVQEAMYRAYRMQEQLSEPLRFGAWLATIVRNAAIDQLRRRQNRREAKEKSADVVSLVSPEQPEATIEALEDMNDMLAVLSPSLAEALRLQVVEKLKVSEIAFRLHIPLGTAKRRLYDARKALRRQHMTVFDESTAKNIVEKAADDIAHLPDSLRRDIIGVAIGGDLARGDFIPNNSGILVFPLFANRESLYMYETPAYREVSRIFDAHCKPFVGCAESPPIWDNLAFDEVHLPVSAECFDPPTIPQPHWHSMYLFDLLDHYQVIYGKDYVKDLYRPDPRKHTLRMASEVLGLIHSRQANPKPPVGFNTVTHWQVLKMVQVLQLHFSSASPTLGRRESLKRYLSSVPDFAIKSFGEKQYRTELKARYPADRREYTDAHAEKCRTFITEACALLQKNR